MKITIGASGKLYIPLGRPLRFIYNSLGKKYKQQQETTKTTKNPNKTNKKPQETNHAKTLLH